MNTKSRINSILKTTSLDTTITGVPTFTLSELDLESNLDIDLPNNLRLGHLAEKVVSELIKSSTNYIVIYENVQLVEDKKTIGELDFIIKEIKSQQVIHLELAYKFYLYDPGISSVEINNWIGPNRNDSLKAKLRKLKKKQFPLLYSECAKKMLIDCDMEAAIQSLCFLVSLYIPYKKKVVLNPIYEEAVKGYYLDYDTFCNIDRIGMSYYLPSKKEWGMDPAENITWSDFNDVKLQIKENLDKKQGPLCWRNYKDTYSSFFIVWW